MNDGKKLTPKQQAFVDQYLIDRNATQAAIRAGYSAKTANEQGARLLANVRVKAAVSGAVGKQSERTKITADDVLLEAMRLVKFDIRKLYRSDGSPIPIHELDDETAAAVQAVDIHEEYTGSGPDRVFVGYTKKYKVADKNSALEKLFKHFGLYEADNRQRHAVEEMSDDMLQKFIALKARETGVKLH